MRLLTVACLIGLMLACGSAVLAQNSDPHVVAGQGPMGSPLCSTQTSLALGNGTVNDDCTVGNGDTITSVSIILPMADFTNGETVSCGISNALLDGGPTQTFIINDVATLGFAPTGPITLPNGQEVEECNYTAFMGTNNDAPSETVATQQFDCSTTNSDNTVANSNAGVPLVDPDDCAGVQAGFDLVTSIAGAVTGSPDDAITENNTGAPEPGSASLLLLGLAGLGFLARRKVMA